MNKNVYSIDVFCNQKDVKKVKDLQLAYHKVHYVNEEPENFFKSTLEHLSDAMQEKRSESQKIDIKKIMKQVEKNKPTIQCFKCGCIMGKEELTKITQTLENKEERKVCEDVIMKIEDPEV